MKVSTFSKCCSATVVEIIERKEPYTLLATVDYLARETENEFYMGWHFVPEEIMNRNIDFFTSSKCETHDAERRECVEIYVK